MAEGDSGDRSLNLYVADTHTLFWYFTASSSLGSKAHGAFDEAKDGQALIYSPAIVLAELYFLNEKKNRSIDYSATPSAEALGYFQASATRTKSSPSSKSSKSSKTLRKSHNPKG